MKNFLLGLILLGSLGVAFSACNCKKKEEVKVPVNEGKVTPEKHTTVSVEKEK